LFGTLIFGSKFKIADFIKNDYDQRQRTGKSVGKQSLKMSVEVDQFTDNECGLQRLFISSARFLTS